eukprot:gene45098-60208_t
MRRHKHSHSNNPSPSSISPMGVSEAVNGFLRERCGRTVKLSTMTVRKEKTDSSVTTNTSTMSTSIYLPSVIVLVGLPGAGKSTFAKALTDAWSSSLSSCEDRDRDRERDRSNMVVRVNKDDMRVKGQVDDTALEALGRGAVVIVDNCNGTQELRELWRSRVRTLSGPVSSTLSFAKTRLTVEARAVCVYFATDVSECKYRAQHRSDHPTLRGPGAASVVDKMASLFLPPTV